MSGVKLNLGVDALEKLFKELDNEVILHIKQAVLEETCKRTVHAIVPKEVKNLIEK